MDDDAGRLVEDDDPVVFEEDGERAFLSLRSASDVGLNPGAHFRHLT
jgi:hypothetical protein